MAIFRYDTPLSRGVDNTVSSITPPHSRIP
jgi:hypothetical protein